MVRMSRAFVMLSLILCCCISGSSAFVVAQVPVQDRQPAGSALRPAVTGPSAGVSTGHPLTTAAAFGILLKGGNAFDAGTASLLAGGVLEQMPGHRLAGERPPRAILRIAGGHPVARDEQPVPKVGHPERTLLQIVVDEPDAAGMAVGLLDHGLAERAEESLDVGLAHQQIERVADHLGLHVGKALGAAALGRFTYQRGPQHRHVR